ncbi:glycosyltransferase [Weissella confusa]|uniref:glycosyltransferase family 2 protein n=1 Tax=Weissella confusa TaxID=1583 RepID=UPI0018A2F490|nr:glycosyltransferase [Weissella confusa]MBF7057194.1 glycosyltransferase [Weissella confusa]
MDKHDYVLSIVISVYNVRGLISELLDSLWAISSENDVELIVVDDGSTDDSRNEVENYFLTHQAPKSWAIYSKVNGGLSSARNLGLSKARGKYIHFVDGDDLVNSQNYKHLVKHIRQQNADIILLNWQKVLYDTTTEGTPFRPLEILGRNEANNDILLVSLLERRIQSYTWSFILKNDIYRTEKISFPITRNWEDFATTYRMFDVSKEFSIFDETIILYRMRDNSISNSKSLDSLKKNVSDVLITASEILNYKFKTAVNPSLVRQFVISFVLLAAQFANQAQSVDRQRVKVFMRNIDKSGIKLKSKIVVLLYYLGIYDALKKGFKTQ